MYFFLIRNLNLRGVFVSKFDFYISISSIKQKMIYNSNALFLLGKIIHP